MLIPTAQIELYAGLGFRLVDEPACGIARVSAGDVCRVPKNEKARRNGRCERARSIRVDDGKPNGARAKLQAGS